ncbi:MAG: S9 family peptidase [Gammaproteobacteria bacterium]|nr:S9 family peptidase [Gammaproteobacteria bacterium]
MKALKMHTTRTRRAMPVTALLAGLLVGLPASFATQADDSATADGLSLELIMQDPDWLGNRPLNAYWLPDSRHVAFQKKREGETFFDDYRLDTESGELERLSAASAAAMPGAGGNFDADRSERVFAKNGDIFVASNGGELVQLTMTAATESAPFFMADGSIAWQVGNDFYIHDRDSGLTRQAAQFLNEDKPDEDKRGFDFLRDQQTRLFSTLRRDKEHADNKQEQELAAKRESGNRMNPPIYLGAGTRTVSTSLSPSGRWMIVTTQPKSHNGGRNDSMPHYVSESGYVENQAVRTLVGENGYADTTAHLVDLSDGTVHALSSARLPGIKDDPFRSLRASAVEYHVANGGDRRAVQNALKAPEKRAVGIEGIKWNEDGSEVAIQYHSRDNKDRWIATVDFDARRLDSQHRLTINEGWINWYYNEYGWLPDGKTLWFLSEESGYSQLYTQRIDRRHQALTRGEFVVSTPWLDPAGEYFYFVANVDRPGTYQVHRVPAAGGAMEQLTTIGIEPDERQDSDDRVSPFMLSPDGSKLLFKHDSPTRPAELYVQAMGEPESARQVTRFTSDEFLAYDWQAPEIVQVPSTHFDGTITSRVYTPDNFDSSQQYPAVVFVHGAGYLQNAHDGWSGYFREFMFHNILVRKGYVVIDMDYRGSRGYGSEWRTEIYRQMGHPELEDLQDGVKWLAENKSVDPERVGIYGGSYGGFMTFMALFRAPGEFAAGASLRPVTDWAHYNHDYTSNILNTPEVDPRAYEKSSPIEWAADYDNTPMLIAHGMEDDNVFFKDSIRLVQRLIELKKENYTIAPYPLDPHGFDNPESWLDEYRRIYKLFEENLK